jgi:hypothetical protein
MQPRPEQVPPRRLFGFLIAGTGVATLAALLSVGFAPGQQGPRGYPSRQLPPQPEQQILPAKGPDAYYFPCSDCHEDEPTNRQVRELEDDHEDIALAHGDLWCLHCHAADDRDRLHLADERNVEFANSWQLCLQCHGNKRESWRAGVHGKRMGHWWGPKEVWTCVSCHRPHAPAFQPIEPEPPPKPPTQITLRSAPRQGETGNE